jgi:hypothetical protein
METITLASIIVAIVGVVQVFKMTGLPSRFAPIASLLIGIAFAIYFTSGLTPQTVFDGIVAGLTACGLWSGGKATLFPGEKAVEVLG